MENKKKNWVVCVCMMTLGPLAWSASVGAESTTLGGFEIQVGGEGESDVAEETPPEPITEPPKADEKPISEPTENFLPEVTQEPQQISQGTEESAAKVQKEEGTEAPAAQTEGGIEAAKNRETEQGSGTEMEEPVRESTGPQPSPTPTLDPGAEKSRREVSETERGKVRQKEGFQRQVQVRGGERLIQISFCSSQDWYLYSFQVNGREIFYHWEGMWCTGEGGIWKEGENQIEAVVCTGDGKVHEMTPWILCFSQEESDGKG